MEESILPSIIIFTYFSSLVGGSRAGEESRYGECIHKGESVPPSINIFYIFYIFSSEAGDI